MYVYGVIKVIVYNDKLLWNIKYKYKSLSYYLFILMNYIG